MERGGAGMFGGLVGVHVETKLFDAVSAQAGMAVKSCLSLPPPPAPARTSHDSPLLPAGNRPPVPHSAAIRDIATVCCDLMECDTIHYDKIRYGIKRK